MGIIDNMFPFRRVKTPTMIQMEETECGAVALAIVLAYYGKYVSIEELRMASGVSRNGSNAYNIIQGAIAYGMDAKGYSLEIENLAHFPLPLILFWKFEHFLVLEGFSKDYVYINDPATGPRRISYDDFDQSFTGVAILCEPSDHFVKSGTPPSLWGSLKRRLRFIKVPLIYTLLTGILLVLPNLAFPALAQIYIDRLFLERLFSWQTGLFIGMMIALIGSGILKYLQGYILNRLHTRLSIQFSCEAFWHMLRLPIAFYNQRYPGEIAYRLILSDKISQTITGNLATTVINVLFIAVYALAIAFYDVSIALIAVEAMLLNFILLRLVWSWRSNANVSYQSDLNKSIAYSLGGLTNIDTIKATGTNIKFFSTWAGYYTKVINALQEVGKKDAILAVLSPFMQSVTILAFLAIGGWKMLQGEMSVGMFVALQILLYNFMNPVSQLVEFSQTIQLLKVDMARMDDIMKNPIDPIFKPIKTGPMIIPKQPLKKLEGYVELHHITFGYSPLEPPLLTDIYLNLHPGKSVALVGPTGCGKSTIARIITGLYVPWKGEVLFDGITRTQMSRQRVVISLSFVEQESFLFHGTVRDNLTLQAPKVDQEDMIRAAKDACIHDDILARSGGYDLIIEENGSNLSGGQRQRFEIARALIKNPSILIMDEATSALDLEVEAQIFKNIRRRGCSLLLIAHRMSTIRNCDEIIVLDKGVIVASGTHEELSEIPGIYRDLIESEKLENKTC